MRFTHKLALAVFAVALALGAVGASAALAAPEWYYSATKTAPEWQQGKAKLTEAQTTKSKGAVTLFDEKLGSEMECESTTEGSVGPGAVGKLTAWKLADCKATPKAINRAGKEVTNSCTKAKSAAITGLPWKSELTMVEELYLTDPVSSEGKELGFKTVCESALGEVEDKCTPEKEKEKLFPLLSNGTGGVNETFPGYPEVWLKCNLGGAEGGRLQSTQLVEATKGSALEANLVEGTFTKLTSSKAIKAKGNLTIEDRGDKLAAECSFTLEGSVGAGSAGKLTSMTGSECKPPAEMKNEKGEEIGNACATVKAIYPVNLPWTTELVETEGKIRDKIASGGAAWHFTCEVALSNMEDECGIAVSPRILDNSENVFALFNETAKTSCHLGGLEAGVWSGELKLTPETGAIKAK
jgi:hypothetical protein